MCISLPTDANLVTVLYWKHATPRTKCADCLVCYSPPGGLIRLLRCIGARYIFFGMQTELSKTHGPTTAGSFLPFPVPSLVQTFREFNPHSKDTPNGVMFPRCSLDVSLQPLHFLLPYQAYLETDSQNLPENKSPGTRSASSECGFWRVEVTDHGPRLCG
jgi:hypothetical protein